MKRLLGRIGKLPAPPSLPDDQDGDHFDPWRPASAYRIAEAGYNVGVTIGGEPAIGVNGWFTQDTGRANWSGTYTRDGVLHGQGQNGPPQRIDLDGVSINGNPNSDVQIVMPRAGEPARPSGMQTIEDFTIRGIRESSRYPDCYYVEVDCGGITTNHYQKRTGYRLNGNGPLLIDPDNLAAYMADRHGPRLRMRPPPTNIVNFTYARRIRHSDPLREDNYVISGYYGTMRPGAGPIDIEGDDEWVGYYNYEGHLQINQSLYGSPAPPDRVRLRDIAHLLNEF